MTYEDRLRRIGWIAIFAVCAALYLALHLKVQSVKSELVHAERQIVALEGHNLLLETEFQTRSSQLQLARWNRVDFGFRPPEASQFITGERQLAMLGTIPATPGRALPGSGPEIELASYSPDEGMGQDETSTGSADRPLLRSRVTGGTIETGLLASAERNPRAPARLALMIPQAKTRIQLSALAD